MNQKPKRNLPYMFPPSVLLTSLSGKAHTDSGIRRVAKAKRHPAKNDKPIKEEKP